jgi:hypothetical protein
MRGTPLFEFVWERGDKQTRKRLHISIGAVAMVPVALLLVGHASESRVALQLISWFTSWVR